MYPYVFVAGPNKHDTLLVFSPLRKLQQYHHGTGATMYADCNVLHELGTDYPERILASRGYSKGHLIPSWVVIRLRVSIFDISLTPENQICK